MGAKNFCVAFGLVAIAGSALACEDKAQPDYGRCLAAEAKGDVLEAATACEAAVKLEPNSSSGKAAAQKLAAMQPAITKAKAEKDAAQAKANETMLAAIIAKQKAAAQAEKEELAALGQKVSCGELTGDDDECVSAGKPRKGRRCTGATYQENERYATTRGCVHTRYISTMTPPDPSWNYYCCPF